MSLFFEDQDPAPRFDQQGRGNETAQAGAQNDHLEIIGWLVHIPNTGWLLMFPCMAKG